MGLLLNKVDYLVLKDTKMFNVFFALAFTSKVSSQVYLIPLPSSKAWERGITSTWYITYLVEDGQVRNYLSRLDTHKFTHLDGMHLKLLRKSMHVAARRHVDSRFLMTWKRKMSCPVSKMVGKTIWETASWWALPQHIRKLGRKSWKYFQSCEGKECERSQCGFTKDKLCLTSLIICCSEKTGCVDESSGCRSSWF